MITISASLRADFMLRVLGTSVATGAPRISCGTPWVSTVSPVLASPPSTPPPGRITPAVPIPAVSGPVGRRPLTVVPRGRRCRCRVVRLVMRDFRSRLLLLGFTSLLCSVGCLRWRLSNTLPLRPRINCCTVRFVLSCSHSSPRNTPKNTPKEKSTKHKNLRPGLRPRLRYQC